MKGFHISDCCLLLSLICFKSLQAYPVFTEIFPRSTPIWYITVDIFVCNRRPSSTLAFPPCLSLLSPLGFLAFLPPYVHSSLSGSVWKCPLHVSSAAQGWMGEEGCVCVCVCVCVVLVEGEGGVSIALTRSVKTHPSLPSPCPCSPPAPPSLPFPLLPPAVTQCRLSAQSSRFSIITSRVWNTPQDDANFHFVQRVF